MQELSLTDSSPPDADTAADMENIAEPQLQEGKQYYYTVIIVLMHDHHFRFLLAMTFAWFSPTSLLVGIIVIAQMQWQNTWDSRLHVSCPNGKAFQRVLSVHSNHHEDRLWQWDCGTVSRSHMDCHWTGYVNKFDGPMQFNCPSNQVLAGAISKHNNRKEDRRWKFRCCSARGYYTKNCYLSGFINHWDKKMHYGVGGSRAFVGLYSFHNNRKE